MQRRSDPIAQSLWHQEHQEGKQQDVESSLSPSISIRRSVPWFGGVSLALTSTHVNGSAIAQLMTV